MRWLHVDPAGGIAGDMWVSALADLAGGEDLLQELAAAIGLHLSLRDVQRSGLRARQLCLEGPVHERPARNASLSEALAALPLGMDARRMAERAVSALLEAESAVHGADPAMVHLHEVGDRDALFDLAAACTLIERLGVQGVSVGAVPVGTGTVQAAHGMLPLPAPATLELLRGYDLRQAPAGEWATPTGAALLVGCAALPHLPPAFRLQATGTGAGGRNPASLPNVLRLWLGEIPAARTWETVVVLEADIDDMTPELLADTVGRLRQSGALDVLQSPTLMKKGRLGTHLVVLTTPALADALVDLMFAHTTTLGLRSHLSHRYVRPRETVSVATPWGTARLKGAPDGQPKPEYEDCRRLSDRSGLPLAHIQRRVLARCSWQPRPP